MIGNFQLEIKGGNFNDSQIIVLLGQNGTGKVKFLGNFCNDSKTTFIKMLAGKLNPDGGEKLPELKVSYKPQQIAFKATCTVR